MHKANVNTYVHTHTIPWLVGLRAGMCLSCFKYLPRMRGEMTACDNTCPPSRTPALYLANCCSGYADKQTPGEGAVIHRLLYTWMISEPVFKWLFLLTRNTSKL